MLETARSNVRSERWLRNALKSERVRIGAVGLGTARPAEWWSGLEAGRLAELEECNANGCQQQTVCSCIGGYEPLAREDCSFRLRFCYAFFPRRILRTTAGVTERGAARLPAPRACGVATLKASMRVACVMAGTETAEADPWNTGRFVWRVTGRRKPSSSSAATSIPPAPRPNTPRMLTAAVGWEETPNASSLLPAVSRSWATARSSRWFRTCLNLACRSSVCENGGDTERRIAKDKRHGTSGRHIPEPYSCNRMDV